MLFLIGARALRQCLRLCAAAGLALALLVASSAVSAHPVPESQVWIDTTPAGLRLTVLLPLNRLELAFGAPLAQAPEAVLSLHGEALTQHLLQHLGVRGDEQSPGWTVRRPVLTVQGSGAGAELCAVIEAQAPAGTDPRRAVLFYDLITHEVRTHRALVFLRNDWAAGFASAAPLLLGELRHGQARLAIPLEPPQPGAAWRRLAGAGMRHIAEGTDHLLFLLMLLLVAPLTAQGGRWQLARGTRQALAQLAKVVTAFTLGHSLTLALGSSAVLQLPVQAVEVAVALSIAVAALHALRPLFADAELVMALLFGLIHGLAFSASLSGAGLTIWQHVQALLAFNLGIEAMQLMLVALVVAPLLLLQRASAGGYRRLRQGAALLGLALALLWAAERAGLMGDSGPPMVSAVPPVDVAALA